jgi:lipopolysaccharide transport system ATP-binding protein
MVRRTRRLVRQIVSPLSRDKAVESNGREDLWALKDVSFEVAQGESLGIIGRNGAGKSTLLKILSRITEPTEGRVRLRGRVASLLEVGTGFHPELTGRENIFLNGAILGMMKAEIKARLDEIISFAEIEKFLDTPVKRYSSGMYMRLAFAVAAHMEPEILLVDEVLAVGDAQFQQKCLGKMNNVAKEGRTIMFVSHQLPAIQSLCERVILLSGGLVSEIGPPSAVIAKYVATGDVGREGRIDLTNYRDRTSFTELAIKEMWIEDDSQNLANSFPMGSGISVCYRFQASRPISKPGFGFGIDDRNGARLFSANNYFIPGGNIPRSSQGGIVRCRFQSLPLQPGEYHVSVSLVEDERTLIDYVERPASFTVEPADVFGSGRIPESSQGVIFVPARIDLES